MKEIIDISEEDYKNLLTDEKIITLTSNLQEVIKNGTPLPNNTTTNGDVIKAMFPNTEAWVGASSDTTCVKIEGIIQIHLVPTDWWNAPYKESGDGNVN